MKKLMIGLWLAGATLWAQPPVCRWRVDDVNVTWTAYKTPLKIGVGGTFANIKFKAKPAKTRVELLRNARMRIQTASVDSGNTARDQKIARAFFAFQGVETIDTNVTEIADDNRTATLEVVMNGIKRAVVVRLKMMQDRISGKGVLDLGDFEMVPSLRNLTEACKKPHRGKTWQDVEVAFDLKIERKCR